ncbi:MAG: 4-alpha-glucanotransferase, partial [Coprococcus sp.]
MKRQSGMLLPISSLPSKYGIGTFSKEAYEFVDLLHETGQSLWQVLPIGPTGYGDSPYQSFSTFAGNPYFIDLEQLIKEGLLAEEECESFDWGNSPDAVSYDKIYLGRFKLLRKAYERYPADKGDEVKAFYEKNIFWLKNYALFMAVKDYMNGQCWTQWPDDIRMRKEDAVARYEEELA